MHIEKANIRYMKKDSMDSRDMDGIRHVKILPWLSVVQSCVGSYDIALGDGDNYSTGEGGFFTASSGIQQTIIHHADSGHMRCRWLFLNLQINGVGSLDDYFEFPTIPTARSELNEAFDELFGSDDLFDNYSSCYRIVGLIMRDAVPKKDGCYSALRPVAEYIEKNYRGKVTIAELASKAHLSESGLYAMFKKQYGTSPIAYLNRYRVSLAAEMLKSSDETIAKIAAAVGISDPFYFNKLFHKIYQTSPKNFRDAYRKNIGGAGKSSRESTFVLDIAGMVCYN